jgi:LL-diaminopimelate aminotransferase
VSEPRARSGAAATSLPLNPLLLGGEDYPFVRLERRARELSPRGVRRIHFGMGDPREETPEFIRATLRDAVTAVSSYPATAGRAELRAACARWLARRFSVSVDPELHVLPVNGTKEAVFLMALAVIDRDAGRRTVVIPTPAYPVYEPGAQFAGADVHITPLTSAAGWRFDPDRVPDEVWDRTALLWLNYPHNPTGAVLTLEDYRRVREKARGHGFWIASDEAYAEVYFDEAPHSLLELGLDHSIALHTLSKRSAMTGYRSGFMAGDERLIEALRRFRPNVGVATPEFVQAAAIAAWNDDAHADEQRGRYAAKRQIFLDAFAERGWTVEASEATFYLWMKVPDGDDMAFVDSLLRVGVVPAPGSMFGPAGRGYVRWALVPTLEDCLEARARILALPDGAAR